LKLKKINIKKRGVVMAENKHYKVIIIGSGPAGLTSAIYTSRAGFSPLVLEGDQPGGQLTITTEIENFPGFPSGVTGPQLMDDMREQARKFGAEVKFESATKVDLSKRPFTIEGEGTTYTADVLIISTGASARWLGIESEQKYMGKGVSACATCDGFFYKEKDVIVVGGGDSALEEATFLTKFAKKVYVAHRRDEFRASKIMIKKGEDNPKVEFLLNKVIDEVTGKDFVEGVKLKDTVSGEISDLAVDGVFMAIGHIPNTKLFEGQLDLDEKGYVNTVPGCTKTDVEGVFACGDVQDTTYRQAITAAGSGCMAALDAEHYLDK
jgi:thioredoxin reductase (NADPH)